jgi:hypothetical protein
MVVPGSVPKSLMSSLAARVSKQSSRKDVKFKSLADISTLQYRRVSTISTVSTHLGGHGRDGRDGGLSPGRPRRGRRVLFLVRGDCSLDVSAQYKGAIIGKVNVQRETTNKGRRKRGLTMTSSPFEADSSRVSSARQTVKADVSNCQQKERERSRGENQWRGKGGVE